MAKPIKVKGKWKATVCVNYRRKSKTFPTKAAAVHWTRQMQVQGVPSGDHTLDQAINRYLREVTPKHKSAKVETCLLRIIMDDPIAVIPLTKLSPRHISAWRDRTLAEVSPDALLRRKGVLSQVITTAIRDWEWCKENPLIGVKWPKPAPSRERTLDDSEIQLFLEKCDSDMLNKVVLFALETGMRRSEILRIRPKHVEGRVVVLPDSKNGLPRHVPLSSTALQMLEEVGYRFDISPQFISQKFRRVCDRAGIENARFHDLRHTAITRMAKIIDNPMTLAKISGHKDLRVLMNYYNPDHEEIASMLG